MNLPINWCMYLILIFTLSLFFTSCKPEFSGLDQNHEDDLIKKCTGSFNKCKSISEAKYSQNVKLLNKEKFNESHKAEEFFQVWKGPLQINFNYETKWTESDYPLKETKLEYPAVLFAITIQNPEMQVPYVVFCGPEGELFANSKVSLGCG